jgi:glycerophosphoryl diester phosphodiesterase
MMYRHLLAAILLIGCANDQSDDLPAQDALIMSDGGILDGISDGATTENDATLSAPDAAPTPDATPTLDAAPIVTAPGPDPARFDCQGGFVDPGRLSPVPLDCVLDPNCHDPMVVAHRGAGGDFGTIAPENGLSAIRAALLMAVDGVELDIRHTVDDKLVVMHDSSVDRTTTGTGDVADMTLAEVIELSLVPGPLVDGRGDFTCERVPTMEAALALTRDRLFVDLDVKTHRIDLVVAELRRLDLIDQVFISVSDAARAFEARTLDPEVRIQIRPDDQSELDDNLALFSRPPEIVEVPPAQVIGLSEQIESVGAKVFTDVFGSDVLAGVVGDVMVYHGHFVDGAQIIQSEYPQLVVQALERWSPPPRR